MPLVTLSASTKYAIILNVPVGDGSNYVGWKVDGSAPTYAAGNWTRTTDGGVSWSIISSYGMVRLWGIQLETNISLMTPLNNTKISGTNINFSINATTNGNLVNASLYIDGVYNATNTFSGTFNETSWIRNVSEGSHNWGVLVCANSICNRTANWTFTTDDFTENSYTYNATTSETKRESFIYNITTNGTVPTNANLVINGTSYTSTITAIAGNNYTFTNNLDIPINYGSMNLYFTFKIGGVQKNSSLKTIDVAQTFLGLCNSSLTTPYLNFTFKNESANEEIIGASVTLSGDYYLGTGSVNKTLSYTNSTQTNSSAFCFTPVDETVNVDYRIQYNSAGFIQRIHEPGITALTNTTTDQVLYLLDDGLGIYVTFQVINTAEQALEGVYVNVTRDIAGSKQFVGTGFTGADGGVTFWLDPNNEHTFAFYHSNYAVYQTTIFPTQSSYTITLGGSGTTVSVPEDYLKGISITVNPQNSTLFNNESYDFDFILSSAFWTVTEFGFVLFNSSGDVVGSNSVSANGGTATTNIPAGNDTDYIRMNYYWVVDGNYTNGTTQWYVLSSEGTDWSIKVFFVDLKNYIDSGMFGMTKFTQGVLVFLIIFMFVGIMSFKYGLTSPAGISGLAFGLVLFFDVGVGIMPNPLEGSLPYFPTIFMGLIMLGIFFRETFR